MTIRRRNQRGWTTHTTACCVLLLSLGGSACGAATTSNAPPMSPSRPSAHDDPLDDLAQGSTPAPTHEKAHEAPAQAQHEAPARLPGHLDPRVAERTLKEYEPLIQQCYERQKADLQKQSGKLTMSMVVRSGGRVIEAHASRNTTGSEPLAKCVAQHLRSVVFAPGPTGGNAQYEYAFFFGQ